MYSWKLEIILNSGKEITAYGTNEFRYADQAAAAFMSGNQNDIVSLSNKERTANIFVRKSEIAAMTISVE